MTSEAFVVAHCMRLHDQRGLRSGALHAPVLIVVAHCMRLL